MRLPSCSGSPRATCQLDAITLCETEPSLVPRGLPWCASPVCCADLPVNDPANLQEQNQPLRRQNLSLTIRRSEAPGAEVFHASGITHLGETGQLRTRIAELEQHLSGLRQQLQGRTGELGAARAADRDLMALANRKPVVSHFESSRVAISARLHT